MVFSTAVALCNQETVPQQATTDKNKQKMLG